MAMRKRHSPEQIVRKLMTADRLLAEGRDTAAVCRELGVSEATYHRWRNQFGGLKADDAKRLRALEAHRSGPTMADRQPAVLAAHACRARAAGARQTRNELRLAR